VKGKGIDYMETEPGWHLGYLAPEDERRARETILASAGITSPAITSEGTA
jgi:transketolase